MKKLTIGSLKYGVTNKHVFIQPPEASERQAISETKRTVKVEQKQQAFHVEVMRGHSILAAALEQKIPLKYSCNKGVCGKCKVKVLAGDSHLHPPNHLEEEKLNEQIQSHYRLACQAVAK
ncbi:2Fe-2S iron-sulfur cluster binding domain-containing protein [Bacillus sp. B15-48]|uniref:2Fe-2S iron-sulfur cluster-binding protein n=1 Tax=Bacillus sp. B15-48 TaxID=1548601 RepID=UPI00193EF4BF|nr:2Fe-2S iron-sulfur cluster binding domain-containing protein [Bacillus sp. B15-48]MBM4761571.1 2Fe-2S iron-sulfur cluster binding domain-containing protein [Bacillus sp. B15-48]